MYKSIYVPVDNSDYSNRAIAGAVGAGQGVRRRSWSAATSTPPSMHDYRFKQMEYTLPEEYLDEVELERQRKIHDSLITMGLKLISDSYLDGMAAPLRRVGPRVRAADDGRQALTPRSSRTSPASTTTWS